MNRMCDLENSDPSDVSRPSASPIDRWLFLAGALALTLATIPANVELAKAQAKAEAKHIRNRFCRLQLLLALVTFEK